MIKPHILAEEASVQAWGQSRSHCGEREMVAPGGGGDSLLGEGVLLRGEKGSRMIPSKLTAELWLLHEDVLRGPR